MVYSWQTPKLKSFETLNTLQRSKKLGFFSLITLWLTVLILKPENEVQILSLKSHFLLQCLFPMGSIVTLLSPFMVFLCWSMCCFLSLVGTFIVYWSVPFVTISTASFQASLSLGKLYMQHYPLCCANWMLHPKRANSFNWTLYVWCLISWGSDHDLKQTKTTTQTFPSSAIIEFFFTG